MLKSIVLFVTREKNAYLAVEPFLSSFLSSFQVVAEWLYENHHGREEEVVHLDVRACLPPFLLPSSLRIFVTSSSAFDSILW